MHPDRFVTIEVERNRKVAEPLSDAPDVLVVPQRLVKEVRRGQHEDDARQEAVKEVHLSCGNGSP